jgi:anti-anti-sigma regulatory factor
MSFGPGGGLTDGRSLALAAAPQPPLEPAGPVLVIAGAIKVADVPKLCVRIRALVAARDARHVVCDVSALAPADLPTIDALARLTLTTRRIGCELRLRNPSSALTDLLGLVGLAEALLSPPSALEPVGQAEEREESGGVEEERDPADPAV